VIRELVPEDREAIEEALTECGAFSEEEIRVALELFDAGAPGGYTLFGAEIEGRVLGYVCLAQASLTQSSWYLYWICVHPAAQGKGVGRALQAKSEEFVRSQGCRRLVLETVAGPICEATFYENAGCESRIDSGFLPSWRRLRDLFEGDRIRIADYAHISGGCMSSRRYGIARHALS
jgi:GNAT superfamily N-acetyltransferase